MISVIIPAYNVERYIGDCLDSVLSQQGVDMEIIVVNDGSSDATMSVIDAYASRHACIKAVSSEHSGPSAARNLALGLCRGEWIAMVDGDDILAPGALKLMLDIASANGNIDIVAGRYRDFTDTLSLADRSGMHTARILSGQEAAEIMLYQNAPHTINPSLWGKLFRSSVWRDKRLTEGLIYEDLELVPQLCAATARIAVTDDIVYGYRRNANSLMHTFSEKRLDALKVTAHLCERFSTDPKLHKAALSRHFSAAFNLWLLMVVNHAGMPREVARCRKIIRRLAKSQLFGRKVRLKNRVGALLQYFPFIFKSSRICKKLLAK